MLTTCRKQVASLGEQACRRAFGLGRLSEQFSRLGENRLPAECCCVSGLGIADRLSGNYSGASHVAWKREQLAGWGCLGLLTRAPKRRIGDFLKGAGAHDATSSTSRSLNNASSSFKTAILISSYRWLIRIRVQIEHTPRSQLPQTHHRVIRRPFHRATIAIASTGPPSNLAIC